VQVAGPKFGAGLQDSPYPSGDTQVADGKTWTRIVATGRTTPSRWRIDLPDALFAAGDIVEFFYGTSTSGLTSYCSGSSLNFVQTRMSPRRRRRSSRFCSSTGPRGADAFYVDGMDGRGSQVYWDTACEQMGFIPTATTCGPRVESREPPGWAVDGQ
jgi:hypothetical protein